MLCKTRFCTTNVHDSFKGIIIHPSTFCLAQFVSICVLEWIPITFKYVSKESQTRAPANTSQTDMYF